MYRVANTVHLTTKAVSFATFVARSFLAHLFLTCAVVAYFVAFTLVILPACALIALLDPHRDASFAEKFFSIVRAFALKI